MSYEIKIRDQLAADLSMIEQGLELVGKEFPLPNLVGSKGFIDILATDVFSNYVIIEIKRSKASSRETMQEILKYVGLIKQNYKAKDSEIRVIIVSTQWEELYVPFCELAAESHLSVRGIKLSLDENARINNTESIIPEIIAPTRRSIQHPYSFDLYHNSEGSEQQIKHLDARSREIGIKDYLIVLIVNPGQTKGNYHYGVVYASNEMTRKEYLRLLEGSNDLDVDEEDFEDADAYNRYLHECLLSLVAEGSKRDGFDSGDPVKFDGAVLMFGWTVELITRSGLFADDPRLSDEMIITELRGLHGSSDTKFLNFGSSLQKGRITEIRNKCVKPFKYFPQWAGYVKDIFHYLDISAKPYRIVINVFCERSLFGSIWWFIKTGDFGYLPTYNIFIDFFEDDALYNFQGVLRWNGRPVDMEAVDKFMHEESEDVFFNKPIDTINGMHDEEICDLLNLEWENYLQIIQDNEKKEGVFTISSSGNLSMSDATSRTITDWLEIELELTDYIAQVYAAHTKEA